MSHGFKTKFPNSKSHLFSQCSIQVSVHIRNIRGDWKYLFGLTANVKKKKLREICSAHIRYSFVCLKFTSRLSDCYRNGCGIQLRDIRLSRTHQCQDTCNIISVVGISASLCHHTQIPNPHRLQLPIPLSLLLILHILQHKYLLCSHRWIALFLSDKPRQGYPKVPLMEIWSQEVTICYL